ncbi:MAG: helix-turn-helix domain-containing protein [Deltaproteobacteria bacterium]|nr:helix-turn-helix domain-containing protein [Deltaproteobacteria bacterium]MBM4322317.1 helix-turn-helix domain-containing protein [Deltaproteobacteria bacterium]
MKEIGETKPSNVTNITNHSNDIKVSNGLSDEKRPTPILNNTKQAYSVKDLTGVLVKSRRRVQDLAKKGMVPGARKIGAHWTFDKEEIDRWLEKGGNAGAAIEPEEPKEERVPEVSKPDTGESSHDSGDLPPDQGGEGAGDIF